MALDPENLEKPFLKLRKLLHNLPEQPSPDEVHDLRTRARRVEATVHALHLERKSKGKKVLKAVTPVRKRAGKVRDMDVLTGLVSSLNGDNQDACRLQLLEHLSQVRFKGTRKLHKTITRRASTANAGLKRCASTIGRKSKNEKGRRQWPADAAAVALQISAEVRDWPKLTARNLHPFRLKVKELRYVLELAGKSGELIRILRSVQDNIGEWHNWVELTAIAKDVLQHPDRCSVLDEIRAQTRQRYGESLKAATRLRNRYFRKSQSRSQRRRNVQPLPQPVLKATAKLAS